MSMSDIESIESDDLSSELPQPKDSTGLNLHVPNLDEMEFEEIGDVKHDTIQSSKTSL